MKTTVTQSKAYPVGSALGSLAAAALMVRDGDMPGEHISIFLALPIMGGSLDGAGEAAGGSALFSDWVGNFVPKPLADGNRAEILQELCAHLRFNLEFVKPANCIPCGMTVYSLT